MRSARAPFVVLTLIMITLAAADLFTGSRAMGVGDVWAALSGVQGPNATILFKFRLPEMLTAILAGTALAASGLVLQSVFRNPLAGPDVLGISSGASIGVAIVVLLTVDPTGSTLVSGLGAFGWGALSVAAALGSAAVLVVVTALARKFDNGVTLLILGLLVGYLAGALVSMLVWFATPHKIQAYLNWTYGSFGSVTTEKLPVFALSVACGLGLSPFLFKPLDAFAMGDRYAASVGVNVRKTRILAIAMASILTGSVTAFCGPIAFLGIAAPQAAKRLFKTARTLVLVPASALIGAIFALLADIVSRVGVSLPINPLLAMVGAPVIIAIVVRHARERRENA